MDASWATILPSSQPSPGEVAQQGMNMRERQFERMASLQQQQQRQQQIDQRYQEGLAEKNASLLSALPKQYNSDNIDMNAVRDRFIGDLNSEANARIKNMPPSDFKQWLDGRVQPMAKWFDNAKVDYDNLQKGLGEYHQELPNVSRTDARNMANMFFSHNHFKDDGTGKLTFNPDAQPIDYISKLKEPETLKHMDVNETPMLNFLSKEIPHEAVGGKEVTDNKGNVHKYAWKGFRNMFSEDAPTKDANGNLVLKMKSENFHNVPQIPQQMEEMINSNPQLKAIYDKKWGQAKDNLMQGGHYDPRLENVHKKAMMFNYASPIMSHPINVSEEDRTPRIRVSVNAGKNGAPPTINDVYSGMSSAVDGANGKMNVSDLPADQQEVALKYARMFSGDNTLSNKNVVVKKDENGELHLTKVKGDKSEEHLGKLDYSINSKANGRDKKTREAINKTITEKRGASVTPKTTASGGMVKFEHEGKTYELSADNFSKMEKEAKKSGASIKRLN